MTDAIVSETVIAQSFEVTKGIVLDADPETSPQVVCRLDGGGTITCDLLHGNGSEELQLAAGDSVLIWHDGKLDEGPYGIIIGRVGPSRVALERPDPEGSEKDSPDELVIEAKHSLTLRVGSGSITIREDGKILIKGKDLVSHAQRLNRIKGGAVQIN